MRLSRRKALQSGVSIGVVSLAGCVNITTPFSPKLTVELLNYDDTPHTLEFQFLREDGQQDTEGTVLNDWYDLPASGKDPAAKRLEDVIVSDRYLIRARLEPKYEVFGHYHYYPDCRNDSTTDKVTIKIKKNPTRGRFIGFDQSHCG